MNKVYLPIPGDPIWALLTYLHSKMNLTEAFDTTINPMLEALDIKKEYHCEKIDGVMCTAYWIHTGYGFATITAENVNGVSIRKIVDVFGPGNIMLHPDGFFNDEKTVCGYWIAKKSVVVPFSRPNFADLRLSAPEANALANCILSENISLGLVKSGIRKMTGLMRLRELIRIFGKDIFQSIAQGELADYLQLSPSYISKLKKKLIKSDVNF